MSQQGLFWGFGCRNLQDFEQIQLFRVGTSCSCVSMTVDTRGVALDLAQDLKRAVW